MRETERARRVPFGEIPWGEDAPGIRAREVEVRGARWAIVEYGAVAAREEWCEEGHRGYVVSGEIEYEFDDGSEPLRASEGEAFFLPPAPPNGGRIGGVTHPRGRPFSFS